MVHWTAGLHCQVDYYDLRQTGTRSQEDNHHINLNSLYQFPIQTKFTLAHAFRSFSKWSQGSLSLWACGAVRYHGKSIWQRRSPNFLAAVGPSSPSKGTSLAICFFHWGSSFKGSTISQDLQRLVTKFPTQEHLKDFQYSNCCGYKNIKRRLLTEIKHHDSQFRNMTLSASL